MTQYLCVLLGTAVLGPIADAFGRVKSLSACLVITFIGGLSSAFAFNNITAFVLCRGIAGFATGSAYPIIFTLAAECVNSRLRAAVLCILWASRAIGVMSLIGIAFLIEKRRILVITITLPLLVAALLCRIVSESPPWKFLRSSLSDDDNSEAKGLLERNVRDDNTPQYRDCLNSWGRLYSASDTGIHCSCFSFLRFKEPRRIIIVLGFSWFSVGLMFQGLNTTSIQLLENLYANFAIRELVNLLGSCAVFILATKAGRRVSTVLSMSLAAVFCLLFSAASDEFLESEEGAVVVVIQLIGRPCAMVALVSLSLYSIELVPTMVRCSALGLVTSFGYLGVAVCPLVMKIELMTHAVVPLGVMGSLSLTSGLFCHFLLPKTKGLTTYTLDDSSKISAQLGAWIPGVHRRRKKSSETGIDRVEMTQSGGADQRNDDQLEQGIIRKSSDDRVSRTSRWEMLSTDDARKNSQLSCSLTVEQSLDEESNLLLEEDIHKLAAHVPSCTWILVYSTFQHGMSLSTLYHRVREVETPVLLVVKDNNGFIFGVFSPTPPGMHSHFCGLGKSFFFTCKPKFQIYPCSGKNSYYTTGDSTGLAFGCSEGTFGLWLDNDLYHGRSTACETYNSEMLSATEDFICLGVEVWTFA
ncbi:PREDICTED: solute carrier family 22 member 13-like [Acropora digitifera]|uniref:solute carrier family 22 member 13-like n=1 Tax=Acropora digitifera TaxID=70779 RepID=UPI00077B2240|nr:PREDICTED: solute carrier family 22 member 13-like [Acropora digitifera]